MSFPLDPTAIRRAKLRLRKAQTAFDDMRHNFYPHGSSNEEAKSRLLIAWYDFLLASNGVYEQLEKAAKSSPQNRQWFGAKKRERKNDELLCYMHQARNADKHGIVDIINMDGEITSKTMEPLYFTGLIDWHEPARRWLPSTIPNSSKYADYVIYPGVIGFLEDITNEFGDIFVAPKEHLGIPIPAPTTHWAAKLTLAYLETLIAAAELRL
jgi:hypothetical protein